MHIWLPKNFLPAPSCPQGRLVLAIGLVLLMLSSPGQARQFETREEVEAAIARYSRLIESQPGNAQNYIERGDAYFLISEFDLAIEDYTEALSRNDNLDQAYYGRGLAYGRRRLVDEGIADLDIFLERNPESSIGFTKRGVRYLWKQDLPSAKRDLEKAIALDRYNAEAHDDLGVVYSLQGDYGRAIELFILTVALDPLYQKGYHNLAMSLYIVGATEGALDVVNQSLRLNPDARDSVNLKGLILQAMGRDDEAARLLEDAEFMAEGNWSESVAITADHGAPEVLLTGLDDARHQFADYFKQSKWIVLNIWGPKCPPCIEEMPQLQAFHDEHAAEDAMVIGLAIDFPSFGYAREDEVREFIDLNSITYPILLGDAEIVNQFGAGPLLGVPTTLVFSPDGKLFGSRVGQVTAEQVEDFIDGGQGGVFKNRLDKQQ